MKKTVCLLVTLYFFLTWGGLQVQATGVAPSFEEVDGHVAESFVASLNIQFLEEEPVEKGIVCFDVRKDGVIAIGFDTVRGDMISIYTKDGIYDRGYIFQNNGSFDILWEETDLHIYCTRAEKVVSLKEDGTVGGVRAYGSDRDYDDFRRNVLHVTERTVGDTIYRLRNRMGPLNLIATSYSQLVAITPDGTERILYDANGALLLGMAVKTILILALVATVIGGIVWYYKMQDTATQHNSLSNNTSS